MRLAATVVVLWIVALAGCTSDDRGQEIEFRVPVSVREVDTGAVEDRVTATGSLRAAETIALRADTSGILVMGRTAEDFRYSEGDRVEAGQVIAEITGDDVKFAARTEATHQRYQSALRDYESKRELFEEGLISELEFRPVEATLAEAKMDWERSQLTETRSKLITPISGVILRLARDEQNQPLADGQLVAQGLEVAQIAPTSRLIADVDLVGPDVSRVEPGDLARVRHFAWEDSTFDGRLLRLAPSLDTVTRTLRAEVALDNHDGRLRPGMFVEVTLIVDRHEEVPVVPRDAVTEREGQKVVFVIKGQRASKRVVTLGLGDDDQVEIQNGIEVGERVVVRGLETLIDGTKVRVTGA